MSVFESKYMILALLITMLGFDFLFGEQEMTIPQDWSMVTRDNCGVDGEQSHLIRGKNWMFTFSEIDSNMVPAGSPLRTVAHDDQVIFQYRGLYSDAQYKVIVRYLSDDKQRVQDFKIDDIKLQENLHLLKSQPMEFTFNVPKDAVKDGQIKLAFTKVKGPNAVVSEIEIWSDKQGLRPVIQIQAYGDFVGGIEGTIRDVNNNQLLYGTEVTAKVNDQIVAKTVTNAAGIFNLKLESSSMKSGSDFIEIIAGKEEIKQSLNLTCEEVFYQPILFRTVPERVGGVKNCRINLNGKWRFNPVPPTAFWNTKTAYSDWPEINVPGEWVMQGFEVKPNTAAAYVRTFDLPSDWHDNQIILRCDAVYSDAKVFVNSHDVGQHRGGLTPFEFDVTPFIRMGEKNTIALAVQNESLEDTLGSITQYAAHQLGGITRKIYLFALPKVNIVNFQIETHFDTDYRNATLKLSGVVVNDSRNELENSKLRIEMADMLGNPVPINAQFPLPHVTAGQNKNFSVEIAVNKPDKWDSEHPNLYTLIVHLEKNGQTLETIREKVGFRQIEIRGNQVFVNDTKIKLRGINRHEVHPVLGRSLNMELWKKDAEIFRDANMNYIRTSHYPPAKEFITICDSLGLFVELEAPFCWIGHGANATWQERSSHDLKLFPSVMLGISEMINHYFNHPSVVIWSMANESAWNRNWERAYRLTNMLDSTRPKSFHDQAYGGYNNFGSNIMPVANMHYPGPDGPEYVKDFERPVIFGEYCHLNTYNRQEIVTDPGVRDYYGVAIAPMWKNMYASTGCLGGAIWSGIDDVFELPEGKAVGYGEWGPIDGWRRKKPEYWHIKKAYSPIRIINKQLENPEPNQPLKIEVENWHDFTNLNELDIEWRLADEKGKVTIDVVPKGKGEILIQTKKRIQSGEKLNLNFRSPRGFDIDTFELPIGKADPGSLSKSRSAESKDPFKLVTNDNTIVLRNLSQEWIVDQQTGKFISGSQNGKEILKGGPQLMMLPLISGPCNTEHSRVISPYNDVCSDWRVIEIITRTTNNAILVSVWGEYNQAEGQYTYHFQNDGAVKVDYDFICSTEIKPRQIGLVFDADESCQILQWDRNAYWTSYPEDHIGRPQGVAHAFPFGRNESTNYRNKPAHAWIYDYHDMGCNDFRATRRNIYHAELRSEAGYGLELFSDGKQHIRAFLNDGKSHLLVANYDIGGADIFLATHYNHERIQLKPGSRIKGSIDLKFSIKE